jgi:hypothetical protein
VRTQRSFGQGVIPGPHSNRVFTGRNRNCRAGKVQRNLSKRLTLPALSHTMPHVAILRFWHSYEGVLPT